MASMDFFGPLQGADGLPEKLNGPALPSTLSRPPVPFAFFTREILLFLTGFEELVIEDYEFLSDRRPAKRTFFLEDGIFLLYRRLFDSFPSLESVRTSFFCEALEVFVFVWVCLFLDE